MTLCKISPTRWIFSYILLPSCAFINVTQLYQKYITDQFSCKKSKSVLRISVDNLLPLKKEICRERFAVPGRDARLHIPTHLFFQVILKHYWQFCFNLNYIMLACHIRNKNVIVSRVMKYITDIINETKLHPFSLRAINTLQLCLKLSPGDLF